MQAAVADGVREVWLSSEDTGAYGERCVGMVRVHGFRDEMIGSECTSSCIFLFAAAKQQEEDPGVTD